MTERLAVGTRSVAIGPWHRASGAPPEPAPPHRGTPDEVWPTLYLIWADRERRVVLGAIDHDGCWALTTEGISDEDIAAALLDLDQGGHVDPERIKRTRRLLLGDAHWSHHGREHGEG